MSVNGRLPGLLAAVTLISSPGAAVAGHIDPCLTTFELHSSAVPAPLVACPQGDTDSFIDQGWWISITILDGTGNPVPSMPPSDIWLMDTFPPTDIALCGGSMSSNADSLTNVNGKTTMSVSTLAGGGCVDGLSVVVQGFVLLDPSDCVTPRIAPINMRSPDIDGSLSVNLVDLSIFASHYPPEAYDTCCDFDLSGAVDLVDLAVFASHYGPPGHSCD